MKKLLFGILTFLGIGLSFCSADSCTSDINACSYSICETVCSDTAGFSIYFNTPGEYYINSFSINNSNGIDFSSVSSQYPTYICNFPEYLNLSSDTEWDDYIRDSTDCFIFTGYTISNSNGNTIFTFDSPYYINSSSTPYFLFVYTLEYSCFEMNYIAGYDWDWRSFNFSLDNNIIYKAPSTRGLYLQPVNICYSENSGPKFKVNYGNTNYEYELNDNLFIHLKSPTIQNGNTFSYAGSTGINLFYNGSSQFYSKSNLYLQSVYWFNNNIFTPICL